MIEIRPIITEAAKPRKAFLLTGAFNPYTVGHEEMARHAAVHARDTGHTHIYHGIGASEKSEDAPLTHAQKRGVIRASHRHLSSEVKGIRFGVLPKQHSTPFHQVLHLAKKGHTHITVGLGSDQMGKKGLKGSLERHVRKHGGMLDQDGKVHPVKLSFKQMGEKRDERPLKRNELLKRLKSGDLTVAKAGHLRKAVRSGDTELAHALMPASADKNKYLSAIAKSQSRLRKPVKEGFISFMEFIGEAPEVDPYIEPSENMLHQKYTKTYADRKKSFPLVKGVSYRYAGHRNLGEIHPGYEMHVHKIAVPWNGDRTVMSHRYTIVHKKTKDVAGEIDATAGKIDRKTGEHKPGIGKGLKIDWVGVHSDHTRKEIGKSLAVAAYKHLHSRGHSIKSDTRQSIGGAHLWDTLRRDPDVKDHVKFHDERDNKAYPAHKVSFDDIWQDHPSAQEKTLVLHAKPKPRKKVVREDIEMANLLVKPSGGYHRDFSRIAAKGNTKRSGRIAKGYSLHSDKVNDDMGGMSQDHYIVHDATNHIAGEVTTMLHGKDKTHTVLHTQIHGDHTRKKIGKSLAVLAYKHLARKHGSLKSSDLQSPGGASVWNRIRKDPRMKGKVFHVSQGKEVPAHDVPDKQIWASEVKIPRSKGTPGYLPASQRFRGEHGAAMHSHLVIRHPRKS
jgi:hypothetical protein